MIRQKRTFDEKLPLLLAFLLPILIMLGIFAGKEIYPFGQNCFLRTDLYHQYVAFFENLSERMNDGKSLTYAFDIGLGSNYTALFAYYLCGPLQILAFLIPKGYIIEFITYLIVLKIGLCGLSMAWYLSKKSGVRDIAAAFCGVCYALSGYLAAYSWNIMWLDVLWLTPIILYSVDLIIEKNKPFLYCITLGLAILCNYYISIMLCIFLVFWFICRMIAADKMNLRQILFKCLQFGIFSLLAGALSAVLVIPAAYALQGTASAGSSFPKTISNYFSIMEMLSRHLVVVEVETGLDHWPNLYCGVGVFLFVPLYYMNKDVNYKEKIVNTFLLFFLLVSFNTNVLNFIWHGMHYPNSLPCRQSFLYNFIMMVMCYDGIRGLTKQTKGRIVGVMWGAILLILIMETLVDPEEVPYYACYASILFIGLYALCAYLYKTRKAETITAVAMALCILVVEMGLNTAVTSVSFVNRTQFVRYDESYDILIEQAEADEIFTRIERDDIRTKNDGPYFGYNSASIFSSTTNSAVTAFYKKVGMEGNTNAYSFKGATPFIASLLSVKYKLSDRMLPESPLYTRVGEAKDTYGSKSYLYENNYTLPLGFLMPSDTEELMSRATGNPVKVQNSLASITAGVGNLLESNPSSISGATLNTTISDDGHYFVHVSSSSVEKVTAYINEESHTYDNVNRGYLVDLGFLYTGDAVRLTAADAKNLTATVYRFKEDRFIEAVNKLNEHPFTVTEFTDTFSKTCISGSVQADNDALLFLSIPYEAPVETMFGIKVPSGGGWTALMDGQPVEIGSIMNAFLGINVPAGEHTLTLSYEPQGLKLGIAVSLIALAILLLILFVQLLLRLIRSSRLQKETAEDLPVSESGTGKERMILIHQIDEKERQKDEEEALLICEEFDKAPEEEVPAELPEDFFEDLELSPELKTAASQETLMPAAEAAEQFIASEETAEFATSSGDVSTDADAS